MAQKYLDDNGLLYLWGKIKSTFTGTAVPNMDGTAATGTSQKFARQDHVHPSDTNKADKSATVSTIAWDSTNKKLTKTINGTTTDVVTAATLRTGLNVADGAEVNQNAFSNVKVGSTTVAADSKTDTLELVAGSNVTLTPDATSDKVTIAATNAVTSVAGKTGAVTLDKSDVGLGNVNNTADSQKLVKGFNASVFIDGLKFSGPSQISRYFYCTTAAATATKVLTNSDMLIYDSEDAEYIHPNGGGIIVVQFKYANTATTAMQFKINNESVYDVNYHGNTIPANAIVANGVYAFVFDGEGSFELIGDLDTNTTYTNMAQSEATAGTATDARSISAKVLNDTIDAKITAAQVGATMFQGTVNANTDISNLTTYKSGWYWVVATAGTYVEETCEVGDMIFCVSNRGSTYSASDFNVVQNNLDIIAITNTEIDTIIAS